jgi:type IV pilus assembly protein PilW
VAAFITRGEDIPPFVPSAPDTITVAYGNGDALPAPVNILTGSLGPTDDFIKIVNALYGFQPGNLVVISESGKPCTLAQVNQIPPATLDNTKLNLQAGTYVDPYTGATQNTRYNNPAGLGTAYTTNGKVYNIGNGPTIKVFSVQNGQLMVQGVGAAAATPIYDNIVQLQAQYGKDLTNDGMVDVFNETTPANAAEWAAVLAVRLAVVARSNLQERPDPDGVCRVTTAISANRPRWIAGDIDVSADPNWQCFRYKVFQTVVPLRNMIWRPY